jgi:protein-S-isoprenylcysteine O-methyltransferase Ste14
MNIWRHLVRQGQKEYSARARFAAIACESVVFVLGIPAFLVWSAGLGSDQWRFTLPLPLLVICLVLPVLGLFLALWTVWVQFRYARGTPVPVMATQRLLTNGPYSLCRNPMALGTLVFYFGIAICLQSFTPLLVVVLFGLGLVTLIKRGEERELFLKFGDEYLLYKQRTPFLIPRLSMLRRKSMP